MKKVLLLALVTISGLSACNRQVCPAYTSTKAPVPTVTASAAAPADRQ